ncbi:hypothetical protein BJV85_001843 [Clostridium acetobutylicum]|uniref:Uncharacterized protein n=1 Tax=Clostridium acetobutylicum (strain ATCC 824 / DSM 792 / JCM 1419 / IAM 19013 / LMG 5710 / NBRC 13948 / NRRL B-527 / VKM B-1787 / 2291 / W) TaxID=272562 RepID=Q97HH7_CLOAB|nr:MULTISPECIES: hypothetical protein [Clostridium]AAK79993.1 Hypothetical protein CA_C2034 [Clostridium acetobutylicum ATCC 824]ADZ21085.1 Conserved hypothetical protein [Clostridium acetobutylicum EA 2018]AEI32141.1 hypothetical protein SMB_G2066 [Clostridium acetobutylicum DSM 1731]AWV79577.1 hypothetical protein DK921_05575 [Clostridium acetobutylicum]MBC2394449.1 hypothetical protein [Clostridium acetobutylicum]
MSIFIQEKINELNKICKGSEKYIEKYNEILKSIVSLKGLYTIVNRNTTDDDVKNNKGKFFLD